MPAQLADAAAADPHARFRVIVQGRPGRRSGGVAADVNGEVAANQDGARGLKRTFRSISGVSAELSGRQILKLASRPGILAITPDVPLAASLLDPPANNTPPSISGSAEVGAALLADPGSWSGAPVAYGYQWQACDAAGVACADLAGATAPAYDPVAGDVGSTLRVVVTATNDGGSSSAASAVTQAVAQPPAADPLPALQPDPTPVPPAPDPTPLANTQPPAISYPPEQASAVDAVPGTWTGAEPLSFAYEWQRCDAAGTSCAPIAAATMSWYTPVAADIGATLRFAVTATDATGASATAVSDASARVLPEAVNGWWSRQLWPYTIGAQSLWAGATETPTIALVDSGIDTSVGGLAGAVATQVSISSLAQADAPDGYGHGTFVAQVAAGRADGYAGVAPGAHLVSLDVMDDDGRAMTSDVIAAADWIYQHKDEYGIRVANFSLIGTSPASVLFDPVDKAVEKLWLSGVVVVAASGNYAADGAESGVTYAPANDPFVIAVGATDLNGSIPAADDFVAPWSAWGYDRDGFVRPDVGAPGRALVEAVPTSSSLYVNRPDRIVEPGYLQLSGTSFAAPVVSGIAARLLALHPNWTPDDVKGALMATATRLPAAAPFSVGFGEVDAAAAAAMAQPPNPDAALERFVVPDPDGGPTPVFDGTAWQAAASADPLWAAESWGTESWGTESWGTESWGTAYWQASAWATESWGTESWGTESWGTESWGTESPTDGAAGDVPDPTPGWIAPK